MISERARHGIDRIFCGAVCSHLALQADDVVRVERLTGAPSNEQPVQIVVLTVTSYLFRLLTLFHVGGDPETVAYFTRNDAQKPFAEVFSEVGNLCCGAINRELGRHFPHTGMSTPYVLASRCLSFLDDLRPSYVAHHRLSINRDIVLHATQCLCAYAPLDFSHDEAAVSEASGVLEFF